MGFQDSRPQQSSLATATSLLQSTSLNEQQHDMFSFSFAGLPGGSTPAGLAGVLPSAAVMDASGARNLQRPSFDARRTAAFGMHVPGGVEHQQAGLSSGIPSIPPNSTKPTQQRPRAQVQPLHCQPQPSSVERDYSDAASSASASRTPSPPPAKENTGRWTTEEHKIFLEGIRLHGKGWKQIAQMIKTRTVVQIRTHAQKYFQKLAKAQQAGNSTAEVTMDTRASSASSATTASLPISIPTSTSSSAHQAGTVAAPSSPSSRGASSRQGSSSPSTKGSRKASGGRKKKPGPSKRKTIQAGLDSGAGASAASRRASASSDRQSKRLAINIPGKAKGPFSSPSPSSIMDVGSAVTNSSPLQEWMAREPSFHDDALLADAMGLEWFAAEVRAVDGIDPHSAHSSSDRSAYGSSDDMSSSHGGSDTEDHKRTKSSVFMAAGAPPGAVEGFLATSEIMETAPPPPLPDLEDAALDLAEHSLIFDAPLDDDYFMNTLLVGDGPAVGTW